MSLKKHFLKSVHVNIYPYLIPISFTLLAVVFFIAARYTDESMIFMMSLYDALSLFFILFAVSFILICLIYYLFQSFQKK